MCHASQGEEGCGVVIRLIWPGCRVQSEVPGVLGSTLPNPHKSMFVGLVVMLTIGFCRVIWQGMRVWDGAR